MEAPACRPLTPPLQDPSLGQQQAEWVAGRAVESNIPDTPQSPAQQLFQSSLPLRRPPLPEKAGFGREHAQDTSSHDGAYCFERNAVSSQFFGPRNVLFGGPRRGLIKSSMPLFCGRLFKHQWLDVERRQKQICELPTCSEGRLCIEPRKARPQRGS